jgi:crotonobetainyl-CoA:carnitine CoA-transferase CaiB-like acyl-CoA transferase
MRGGKRSVTLDLQDRAERADLDRLLADADVCIPTMRPRTLQRPGLTRDRLASFTSRLVNCAVTGFDMSRPWAVLPGYEALVMNELGMIQSKARGRLHDAARGCWPCAGRVPPVRGPSP